MYRRQAAVAAAAVNAGGGGGAASQVSVVCHGDDRGFVFDRVLHWSSLLDDSIGVLGGTVGLG